MIRLHSGIIGCVLFFIFLPLASASPSATKFVKTWQKGTASTWTVPLPNNNASMQAPMLPSSKVELPPSEAVQGPQSQVQAPTTAPLTPPEHNTDAKQPDGLPDATLNQ